ncbi:MAG: hypothetical protein NTY38_00260, partial [Acidobacteria bacterium]|nr:hypothetical protein [Acidobacteriota bacterium]
MRTSAVVSLFALSLTGCSRTPSKPFTQFVDEVVYEVLALSPITATQYGYHEHKGQKLDELLDDYSAKSMAGQREFFQGIQDRLGSYKAGELTPEARIDHRILSDLASLNLLELDTIQNYRHNPT